MTRQVDGGGRQTRSFRVTMSLPEGATAAMGRAYIINALTSERGILDPEGDPMSMFDPVSLVVSYSRKPTHGQNPGGSDV